MSGPAGWRNTPRFSVHTRWTNPLQNSIKWHKLKVRTESELACMSINAVTDAERAIAYLAHLQGQHSVPDELYIAILDHHDTFEAGIAYAALAFHRDYGNGGLAQALSNRSGEVDAVLRAFEAMGEQITPVGAIVADAVALHRFLPGTESDGWAAYEAAHDAAEAQWDALDERYQAATYPVPGGPNTLETAVLSYALDHATAFSAAVRAVGRRG